MANTPRVTVVIPTFDRAALLAEAVESVLHQSWRDLEIVVCDDGSTDGTATRVAAFGEPVRYLRLDHAGMPGRTRNRGIAAARGELIAFLDDDDLWQPDKLALQVELMDRENLDLVYADRLVEYVDRSRSEVAVTRSPEDPAGLLDLVLQGQVPHVCTLLVHRSALSGIGGFDESLETGEDLDLLVRLSPLVRAGRVPLPLVTVRRRTGTLSDRSAHAAFRNAARVMARQLAAGTLTPRQARRCRATLAHLECGLAAALTAGRDIAGARRAALRAVRHAPVSREAWGALLKAGPITALRGGGPRRS